MSGFPVSNVVTAFANLGSNTGEAIRIDFDAVFNPPSSGGAPAWSVEGFNIRITITVPQGRPLPNSFSAEIWPSTGGSLGPINVASIGGQVYSGAYPQNSTILLRTGGDGSNGNYLQYHGFTAQGGPDLIDPWNGTNRFQTNLYFACGFPFQPPV